MNEEQYLRHKPFAGPLKPSMLRRAPFNDYHARRIYLLTVTTVNRYPWLGKVVTGRENHHAQPVSPRLFSHPPS